LSHTHTEITNIPIAPQSTWLTEVITETEERRARSVSQSVSSVAVITTPNCISEATLDSVSRHSTAHQ